MARLPNDPFAEQWGYKDAKVYEAWDKATGSSDVVVAVIDDGFDTFHPDIYPNAWKNIDEIPDNQIDDDKNGYIDDVWGWDFSSYDVNHDGVISDSEMEGNNEPRPWVVNRENIVDDIHHGTLVAGLIGAVGDNNLAGAGINWKVKLMNLKVLEVAGQGSLSPLTRAIYYAADNGANIINISLVGDADGDVKKAIKYAYDKGVVVVAAAGNERVALNLSPVYPVCADANESEEWVLGVSAVGIDHYLAQFSNTGSNCIDITAPGVHVSSTMRYAPRQGLDKMYGDKWNGTSFAAPFVSGAAALIKSIQPSWGPKQIFEAILSTVHRTPPKDVKAYEDMYGAGLLQINKAVDYALSKKTSTHILAGFIAANLNTGEIEENKVDDTKNVITEKRSALVKIDDVVKYQDGYVTVKILNKNKSKVVVYDKTWKEVQGFEVKSSGKLRLAVGNIRGDEQMEIILVPSYKDKNVMTAYDLSGKELDRFDIDTAHAGVNLTLVDTNNGKKEIATVYRYKDKTKIHLFDGDLNLFSFIDLDFVKTTGQIVSGDIDGDGVQDLIVAAGAGETPFVAYYNLDGSLKRKFYGYDTKYTGGLNLMVGDFDKNGKDDVLIAPKLKEGTLTAWDYRSKKLGGWTFKLSGEAKFLPVY